MNKKAGHSDNSARDWLDPLKSGCESEKTRNENLVEHDMEPPADGMLLAKFILETSYLSRQIIRQTNNLSEYKFEDEFWRIICLDIYLFIPGNIVKI